MGETYDLGPYQVTLADVHEEKGPNYTASMAEMRVTRDGAPFATMYPEKRFYQVAGMPTTEAAIHQGLFSDLYLVIGDPQEGGGFAVRGYIKPLPTDLGRALLMALGGLLSLSDRRYRIAAAGARKMAAAAPLRQSRARDAPPDPCPALLASPAFAVQPDEMLSDPALEARARAISHDLRCPVCQGEMIDDPAAPISRDLRLAVRERLKAGDTDAQVVEYIVDRYGEFVLFKPRTNGSGLILAAGGACDAGSGGAIAYATVRRRSKAKEAAPNLTEADKQRLQELIES